MIYRRVGWVLGALAVAIIVPAHAHAQPPVQCLTNTPKGKQVYIPCDLLNAGANYPPGSAVLDRLISTRAMCATGVAKH
ncbi:MAG: hypothetical protein WBM01_16260 [Mycobacterium sp.]|uniref:hypothetical protein n=1 Tax=Mycobacterium sp. TaxID=1785 RepID=UPI003C7317C4